MTLLVDRPDDPPTLAEIVRETAMSRATAHAVVTELCTLGWVGRNSDNTYRLGVEFLATGRRAARIDIVAGAAESALDQLVADTGLPAFLARRDGDAIVTSAHVVPASASAAGVGMPPRGTAPPQRHRMRVRPPLCREFVAWSDEPEREAWLALAPADQRRRLVAVLAAVRERGYSVERITDHHRSVIDALGDLTEMPSTVRDRMAALVSELSAIDYLPDELSGEVGVVSVGAPVFDADGAVTAALVSQPDATMPAADLAALGDAVVDAADSVSAALAP